MSFNPLKKLKSLLNKSAVIQLEIERESQRQKPDWVRLITLKKQRLVIKDAINRLRTGRPWASYAG